MATKNIKGITIEIGGDTSELSKALKGVNKQIKETTADLKDVNKLLKMDPGNAELLAQKQKLLNEAIESTKKKLDTEREALRQLASQDSTPEIQKQQDALQREIIETEQELKKLEAQAKQTGDSMSRSLQNAGSKMQEVGGKISDVGTSLTKNVTAPIAAVGVASAAAFNEVDKGLDTVASKTGATGEQLEELTDEMKDLYGSMAISAEDAGTAIGEVNTRFGYTGEQLEETSRAFAKFARVAETDLNTSIDNTDKLMDKFNVDAKDLESVLGLMAKAGQDSGISMSDLQSTLTANSGTLQEMGLGLVDSVNLLAAMESNGVEASAAMTGLKRAVVDAAKNGKSADQALDDIIKSIKTAKSDTEALALAQEAFGTRGASEMATAIRSGRFELDAAGKSLKDYAGIVDATYAEMAGPQEDLQVAMNNLKLVGAELAGEGAKVLVPLLQELTTALKSFNEWFSGLSDNTKQMIVKIGLIVAAIGPLLVVVGNVISAIGTIASAVGTAMPVITGALATVGGWLAPIGEGLAAIAGVLTGPIIAAIAAVVAAVLVWIHNWEYIKQIPEGIWFLFTQWLDKLKARILMDVEMLKVAFNYIKDSIASAVTSVVATVTGVVNRISTLFNQLVAGAKKWGSDLISGFISGIKSGISGLAGAVKGAAGVVRSYIHFSEPDKGPLADFNTYAPDMLKNFAQGITRNLDILNNPMSAMAEKLNPTTNVQVGYDPALGNQLNNLGTAIAGINTQPTPVNITLEGDAAGVFNLVKGQNAQYKRSNGRSAFA